MAEIDAMVADFPGLLGVMNASKETADVCSLLKKAHEAYGPNFGWGDAAATVVRFGDYDTTKLAFREMVRLGVFNKRKPYVRPYMRGGTIYKNKNEEIPALIFSVCMQNAEALRALIDLELDLDVRSPGLSRWGERGPGGRAALHFCAEHLVGAAMARALLAAGAQHSPLDSNLDTPAHLAARLGHAELLNELLDAGADPGARNHAGESVIDAARRAPNNPALPLLQARSSRGLLRSYARARARSPV